MRNIELLIKPVSYDCNLNCGYCFYKSTKNIYSENTPIMNENVLEKLIQKSLFYSNAGTAIFSWQGGEPLLAGIDFFRKVIDFQKKYGKSGQIVGNSIQTNGILLNEEWFKLFKEYNTFIGISLDGNEEIHNYYRGKSFSKTMQAISLLKKENVEFNILTVINNFNANKSKEMYDFFLQNNFFYIQLIPCVEKDEKGNITSFSIESKSYGKFLCEFFDLWYNDGKPKISVRFFDNILEVLAGLNPGYCEFKDTCGDYLVIEYNGDIYPCDFFVKSEWKLGNILENSFEELFSKNKITFGSLKSKVNETCKKCKWFFICKGGCLKYRMINDNKYYELDYFCDSYKEFFEYSHHKLKNILQLKK
ncbi:MAG: anaerobic sulfatase maturase [bacterium]